MQNTDPYVFGDRFLYSNCRQNNKRGPLSTQYLARGSLILFGSASAGEFVIDTAFVVSEAQRMSAAVVNNLVGVDPVFKTVVLDVLYRERKNDHNRLYAGATPSSRVGRMFSFFPCRPASEAPRGFRRPSIRLGRLVNRDSWQNCKITRVGSLERMEKLWLRIVRQVLRQGLSLGVYAATPEEAPDNHQPVGGGRRRYSLTAC